MSKASILKMLTMMLMYLGLAGVQTEDKRSDAPSAYWAIHTLNHPCHFLDPQAPSFAESLRVHQITDTFHGLSKPKNSDQSDLGFARRKLSPAHTHLATAPHCHMVVHIFVPLRKPRMTSLEFANSSSQAGKKKAVQVYVSAPVNTRKPVEWLWYWTNILHIHRVRVHENAMICLWSWAFSLENRTHSGSHVKPKRDHAPTVPVHDCMVM